MTDADVMAAEAARVKAHVSADPVALATLLDADFAYTHGSGKTETRDSYLAFLASRQVRFASIEHSDVVIHRYGEVAIMTGRVQVSLVQDGKARSIPNRFISVWVDRSGQWKLVAFQHTVIGG